MSSPRSLGELAEVVGGTCEGNSSVLIHGVADLEGGRAEGDLVFCAPSV